MVNFYWQNALTLDWAVGLYFWQIHSSDGGVFASARREIREKTGCGIDDLRHIGDYYVKILEGGEVISDTFSHVFLVEIPAEKLSNLELGDSVWISKEKMRDLDLIPDTLDLVEITERKQKRNFSPSWNMKFLNSSKLLKILQKIA